MRNETLEMLNKIKLEKDELKEQFEKNSFDCSTYSNDDLLDGRDIEMSVKNNQKLNLNKQNGINEILEKYANNDKSVNHEGYGDRTLGGTDKGEGGGSSLRLRIGLLGLTMGGGGRGVGGGSDGGCDGEGGGDRWGRGRAGRGD